MKQTMSEGQLEEAYDAYGAAVYRLAVAYLGQSADAEDVTQETFFRLFSRAPDFSDEGHKKRWLLRVASNLCRNQLRGFWRKRVARMDEEALASCIGGDAPSSAEREALLDVLSLPEQYRLPIHLYYYEGYSVAEIAEILNLGKSAVKMRLKRGRERLKMEWEG